MWARNDRIVPVVMFHSVGMRSANWIWSSLTEGVEVFESLLVRLKRHGFKSAGLDALYDHMAATSSTGSVSSIVLTFDDGYLDNWVFVAPLLRKYGMQGVVYVTPEFVQTGDELRPTIEDVSRGTISPDDLETTGFMNWAELRRLQEEGTLDIQSHAHTHTWYFCDNKVVDIHRPRKVHRYPWLSWNARPDRKPSI